MEAQLSLIEKMAIKISRLNEFTTFRRFQFLYASKFLAYCIKQITKNRIFFDNIEWMREFNPEKGMVFVGNHRSFFDLTITMLGLCAKKIAWQRRYSFPVRSNFFYDNLLGILFNYLIMGGVLYPPFFRDPHKKYWNQDALNRICDFLSHGAIIGMHPEGTRGRGPDPYLLSPAKAGIGQIIFQSQPIVIPFFINGLSNSFIKCVKDNRKKNSRSNPIVIAYGKPIDYHQYITMEPSNALFKQISEDVLNEIKALIPREKEIRRACLMGEISSHNPGWMQHGALN